MGDLLEIARAAADYGGVAGVVSAVFIWLYLQSRKELAAERQRCADLTAKLVETGDKMATAMMSSAVATEGLREVVRAASPR